MTDTIDAAGIVAALLKRAYDALGEDLPLPVFNKLAFDLECALAAPASDGRNAG